MEFETCAVCGRTILRGERSFAYVDPEAAEASVCPLCKPRAEAQGWLPAEFAASMPQPQPRRRRGPTALRERFVRTIAPEPEPESDDEPEAPAAPPDPLEVFNASAEVRTVAGLRRSLGEPRVCVRPDGDGLGAVVIVAWDLSWYRWTVRERSVKQVAKGNEISELPLGDRDWNATTVEDGRIERG